MSRQSSLGMDGVAAISYMNIQPPCWEKKGNIIEGSRRHPEEQLTKDIMSYRRDAWTYLKTARYSVNHRRLFECVPIPGWTDLHPYVAI